MQRRFQHGLQVLPLVLIACGGHDGSQGDDETSDAASATDGRVVDASTADGGVNDIALVCPPGQTRVVVTHTQSVPFTEESKAVVSLAPGGAGVISALAIEFNVTHADVGDVEISLVGDTTSVQLATRHGGSNENYRDTVLDDFAEVPLGQRVPFTGRFRPDQPMYAFYGQPASAPLAIHVIDGLAIPGPQFAHAGTLDDVTLVACVCTDCNVGAACVTSDCADPACATDRRCAPETRCSDGEDDDFDGQIDCADLDCDGVGTCEPVGETTCDDDLDNDGDGLIDCADPDCQAAPLCAPETDCRNGIDDDGDGKADCADPGCRASGACEPDERTCNDGLDNDGDGTVDCADPDCASACTLLVPELFPLFYCSAPRLLVRGPVAGLPVATVDFGVRHLVGRVDRVGHIEAAAVLLSATHSRIGDVYIDIGDPLGLGSARLCQDLMPYDGPVVFDNAIFGSPGWNGIYGRPFFTGNGSPYGGTYASNFLPHDLEAYGGWHIDIGDDASGENGTVTRAEMIMCIDPE